MKNPNLFQPIQLGNTFFRNRIFASPTGYQNIDGTDYPLGDCVTATNITNATSTAYGIAKDIGKNF